MAMRDIALRPRARKQSLTARQMKALRLIREGRLEPILVHHYEFMAGRQRLTQAVFELHAKGLIGWEHTETGIELRLISG